VFLRGVFLTPGVHRIQLVYSPDAFVLGAIIRLTTLTVLFIAYAISLFRKQRSPRTQHTTSNGG
jgi:hypothetical protein